MKVRFRTGEIAKLYGISKQTIIYYDRIGLFQPSEADPDTGYRYYNLEQCEVLDTILALKHLGMTLKGIKHYLSRKTTEERLALLEKQEGEIAQKLTIIERSRRRIKSMIRTFRERMEIVPFQMGVRRMEKRGISCVQVKPPYDHYQLEVAIKESYQLVMDEHDSGLHELMTVVDYGEDGKGRFQKVGMYVDGQGNDAIPAGDYAYIIHKGPYEMIVKSAWKLLEYIDGLQLKPSGSFVDNILMDHMAVSSEDDYLVEVMVPVVPR